MEKTILLLVIKESLYPPVVQYSNVTKDKSLIIKENLGKAGVYRWINNSNGNSYVGSSIDLGVRLRGYLNINFLSRGIRLSKSMINRALLKNKYQDFRLEILEYCDPSLTRLRLVFLFLGGEAASYFLFFFKKIKN